MSPHLASVPSPMPGAGLTSSRTFPLAGPRTAPVEDSGAAPVAPAAQRPSCFRHVVLRLFAPMQSGHLTVELPDGGKVEFGQASPFARPRLPLGMARSARLRVHREDFFRKCALAGDVGFGESYVDGDWDSPDLAAVLSWFLLNLENAPTLSGASRPRVRGWFVNLMRFANRVAHLARSNSRANARRNIGAHYDVSNDFFRLLLDPSMMYSAARFSHPGQSLEEAQFDKNEALCRALRLKPSNRVLEIGTGWGGWAIHAARRYNCRITTITLSEQQHRFALDRVAQEGLAHRITVSRMDYRDIRERYDKIVSIEMLEAVGHRYLPEFCRVVARALQPDGLLALQFITCPDARYAEFRSGIDFIQKHIFPGSLLLSLNRVNEQLSRAGGLVANQVVDFGHDYARTLRHWAKNLHARRSELPALGFDDGFFRKWWYYLHYCEAAFAMRNISVVQTLHTRPNNLGL